jgi:hypothetical protein
MQRKKNLPVFIDVCAHSRRSPLAAAAAAVSILLLGIAGCAKIADPQPPELLVPRAATDLSADQRADFVVLEVSVPQQNTNGTPVKALPRVQVYRLADNSSVTNPKTQIPPDQFLAEAVPVLSIPGERLPEYVHQNRLVVEDRFSGMEQSSIFSLAFRYAVLFVNDKNQASGFSNQAVIAPVAIPAAPKDLMAEARDSSIDLKWTPPMENMDGSKPPRIGGYNIYRSTGPEFSEKTRLNSKPLRIPQFKDTHFQFDRTYRYSISVVGGSGNPSVESLLSEDVTVTPRDIFPPLPPEKFSAVFEGGTVLLIWIPPASPDVAGYRITRREEGMDAGQSLREQLITANSYRDETVSPGRKYIYSIIAVDTHGNASASVETEITVR